MNWERGNLHWERGNLHRECHSWGTVEILWILKKMQSNPQHRRGSRFTSAGFISDLKQVTPCV